MSNKTPTPSEPDDIDFTDWKPSVSKDEDLPARKVERYVITVAQRDDCEPMNFFEMTKFIRSRVSDGTVLDVIGVSLLVSSRPLEGEVEPND